MPKFRNVPFNAILAVDDVEARDLNEQPNSDGFKFDSSPLFRVSSVFNVKELRSLPYRAM